MRITVADVAGGAKLAVLTSKLEAITVTKADLIADLSFAGVSGEIAAFIRRLSGCGDGHA